MNISVKKYDTFFSYHWRDHAAVEALAQQMRAQGLRVFLDRWYLTPGRSWPKTLEEILMSCRSVAVFIGPDGMGSWQQREKDLALDRQVHEEEFTVIPVLLPGAEPALGFLYLNTWVDFRNGLEDSLSLGLLQAAIKGEPASPEIHDRLLSTLASICPYRGLRPFREEDAPFFFGREALVERLTDVVREHSMVALVGASGSGKSSVARAGLIPRVRREIGSQVWEVLTLLPGDNPIYALAAVFIPTLEPEMSEADRLAEIGKLARYLNDGTVRLRDIVTRSLKKQSGTDRIFLLVDQWEELYTLCTDAHTRQQFIDELLSATAHSPLTITLTLRGDFFGHVINYRPLSDRLQDAIVNVGPMNNEELKRAITFPAEKIGLSFQAGLAERILDDLNDEPGSLPLLEYLLTALWEERRSGQLHHDVYESMGELKGAMANRAERVIAQLNPMERELVQRVFIQLVRPGEGTEDTRRRATFTEVGEASLPILHKLTDERLLVMGRDEAIGQETVEVAHEFLIRHWARLRQWVDQDRTFLLWCQRLRISLLEWERTGKDSETLLRGMPLAEAEDWLIKRGNDLTDVQRDFIQKSIERRDQEADAIVKRRFRLNILAIGTAIVLLVMGTFAGVQWRVAEQSKQIAVEKLTRIAWNNGISYRDREDAPLKAAHYFMQAAMNANEPAFSKNAQLAADVLSRYLSLHSIIEHEEPIRGFTLNKDQRLMLTWSYDHTARIWDVETGVQLTSPMKHAHTVKFASFSENEKKVITWGFDNIVRIWDSETGTPLTSPLQHPESIEDIAFSGDLKKILTWGRKKALLWDSRSGDHVELPIDYKTAWMEGAQFFKRGQQILLWMETRSNYKENGESSSYSPSGGLLQLLDSRTGQSVVPQMKHKGPVTRAIFNNAHNQILAWDKHGTARLWDSKSGQLLTPEIKHDGAIYGAVFSQTEDRILTWSADQTARVWNSKTGKALSVPLKHNNVLKGAMFTPDGQRVLTWDIDGTARLWDVNLGVPITPFLGHDEKVKKSSYATPSYPATGIGVNKNYDSFLTWNRNTCHLWSKSKGFNTSLLLHHDDEINGAIFSPTRNSVITWSEDRTARIWKAESGQSYSFNLTHKYPIENVIVSRDEQRIFTFAADAIRIWRWNEETRASGNSDDYFDYESAFRNMQLYHDPDLILTVTKDGVHLRDTILPLQHENQINGAVLNKARTKILSWSDDFTARLWDSQDGKSLIPPLRHNEKVQGALFSPDERRILTWSAARVFRGGSGSVRVWDSETGRPLFPFIHYGDDVNGAMFTRDGRRFLIWTDTGVARVWNSETGQPVTPEMKHGTRIYRAIFNKNETRILTFSRDRTARVWDSTTGLPISQSMEHHDRVWGANFSKDEQRVFTWSRDGMGRVWDSVTGKPLTPFMQHSGRPVGASFNHDDSRILMWSEDEVASLWDSNTGHAIIPYLKNLHDWSFPIDYNFPREYLILQLEVKTGTRLDDSGEVEALAADEWKAKKTELSHLNYGVRTSNRPHNHRLEKDAR